MKNYKPGKYKKGKIWDPSKDKIYKSKMEVSDNNLLVSGCIFVICREQTWVGLPKRMVYILLKTIKLI